ncbi:hypothetical protein P8452_72228 [Trifolium repens]|nr:hypothetical protein P8452_72228 [Trifolium repens]
MFKSFWVPISSPLFAAYEYCAHKFQLEIVVNLDVLTTAVLGGSLSIFMGLFLGAGLDNPLMQGTQMELSSWISATAFSVMGTIKTRNHKYYCCRWMCYWRCNIISIRHTKTKYIISAEKNTKFKQSNSRYLITDPSKIFSDPTNLTTACAGCVGFMAFSIAIDKFLERHGYLPLPILSGIVWELGEKKKEGF